MEDYPHDTLARMEQLVANEKEPDVMTDVDKINCKKLSREATIPTKSHTQDAGWDLYASADGTVLPSGRKLVKTDIAMAIPEGYVGLIWPRSGLATKNGIDVLAGVVDSGYRGGIGVCLYNTSQISLVIKRGDRIAQIIFHKIPEVKLREVVDLEDSNRGICGFGSSGS